MPCDGGHSSSPVFVIQQRFGAWLVGIYFDHAVSHGIVARKLRLLRRFSDADFRAPTGPESHHLTRAGDGFQIRPFPPGEFLIAFRQLEIKISALRWRIGSRIVGTFLGYDEDS